MMHDSVREAMTELAPHEEPTTTGTVFLVLILLAIIAGIWLIMYLRLLDR
ncbi:MAG: cytochrome c oxidase subunit 2A [Gemmatimonadetes bacterium]|nr:cytochrome c oxidase subunit 2A [Gemmatimonadota bacterium]